MTHTFKPLDPPFTFDNHKIRAATDTAGNAWFNAKDVFNALGIVWRDSKTKLSNAEPVSAQEKRWLQCLLEARAKFLVLELARRKRIKLVSTKEQHQPNACSDKVPASRKL